MIHAIELVTSTTQQDNPSTEPSPGPPDWSASLLQDRINQNVLGTHTEVLAEQASGMSENDPSDGGTTHLRGQFRVDSASGKTALLDDVESGVAIDADWYEVRYHECAHDEAQPSECPDWTAERDGGTVPNDV